MRILLIDNYDSFTYNLLQRIGELDRAAADTMVVARNDRISVEQARAIAPTHLVISPGPCSPKQSGISPRLIAEFRGRIPILGVCLGHQTIADVHGMVVKRHSTLMHGKTSEIHHDGRGIFDGLPMPFVAARYHSLIVEPASVPREFEISAWTSAGEIMALRWRPPPPRKNNSRPSFSAPMDGVQFHPESFLTSCGPALLANFLRMGMLQSMSRRGDGSQAAESGQSSAMLMRSLAAGS